MPDDRQPILTERDADRDDEAARAALAERIVMVRARFLDGLDERLADLARLARSAGVQGDAPGTDGLDALRRGLHGLAGTAPTIGLARLGAEARQLEQALGDALAANGRLTLSASEDLAIRIERLSSTGN